MRSDWQTASGFTLVEMIVVIVITAIVGAFVAVFLKAPVQEYLDIERRAEMTDIADTALRRIGRDIHTAVPNSVRLPTAAGSSYLEFLPTSTGGRYHTTATATNACAVIANDVDGDALSFDAADTCFGILGPEISFTSGDQIVLGSIQPDGNMPYDSTASGVLRAHTNGALGAQSIVVMPSAAQFPASAVVGGQRFVVVPGDQQAVTYSCENVGVANGEGSGILRRYWQYGFNTPQVAPSYPPSKGYSAILADKVSSCNFVYNTVNQRLGLVEITLGITHGGESISLYHEIHVNNAP